VRILARGRGGAVGLLLAPLRAPVVLFLAPIDPRELLLALVRFLEHAVLQRRETQRARLPAKPGPRCIEVALRDRPDVLGLQALGALLHFELDLLPLGQRAEAFRHDGGVMAEDVGAAVVLHDESEALRIVEPLHGTCDRLQTSFTFATAPCRRAAAAASGGLTPTGRKRIRQGAVNPGCRPPRRRRGRRARPPRREPRTTACPRAGGARAARPPSPPGAARRWGSRARARRS